MSDDARTPEPLARIRAVEARFERHQLAALYGGHLGIRGAGLYGALGAGIDLLAGAASCRWGCSGATHVVENVLRRIVNAALGSLRLATGGYYDEALATLRVCAESVNLVELFVADPAQELAWNSATATDRQKQFRPVKVRESLVTAGISPAYDHVAYAALCDAGVHLTPESAKQSHDFEREQVYVGPYASVPALLLIWTELGYAVAKTLEVLMRLPTIGDSVRAEAMKAHDALLAAVGSGELRVSAYRSTRAWFREGVASGEIPV